MLAHRDFLRRMEQQVAGFWDGQTLRTCASILPFIDLSGTRSTELARRMGISKQAVGRQIRFLDEQGLIKCVADPNDGRAFLVKFTRAGIRRLEQLQGAIKNIERDLEESLGTAEMRIARDVLFQIAYGRVPDGEDG